MVSQLTIGLLADYPQAIPLLETWFEREWAPYYGPDGPGNAGNDLRASCGRTELPSAFVAIIDGEVCGTAALKTESVTTYPHLSPWLAALLVLPTFRRRGVAERLIAAVEEKARELGFGHIYVGTGEGSGTPESALHKRGWQFIEKTPYLVADVVLSRKVL